MTEPAWIAVDWGTTHLRAWAMDEAGVALDAKRSDAGMATLDGRDAFEQALLALIEPWLTSGGRTTVIACGMVGARQGWIEADYVALPAPPLSRAALCPAPASDPRLAVLIVPGLKLDEPPEVLRGEETQIAGLLATDPEFDGVVCVPGTHCKWARVHRGVITFFRTFMTGEMFSLLADHSILRHSVGTPITQAAFEREFEYASQAPLAALMNLFFIRGADLLHGDNASARARLSATLIACELDLARIFWDGFRVAIVGTGQLAGFYRQALAVEGHPHRGVRRRSPDHCGVDRGLPRDPERTHA